MKKPSETYDIPTENLIWLEDKIAKLNRKAQKLNCPAIELTILGVREVEHEGQIYRIHTTTVEGEAPKLGDWRFVAALEHGEKGNIVLGVPGEETPERFRHVEPWCEYCKTVRNRIKSYVVAKSDEYVQVGSNCLKDFTGHPSPHDVVKFAQWLTEALQACEDAEYDPDNVGSYGADLINTVLFLSYAVRSVKRFGYISRSKAIWGEITTADHALNYLLYKGSDKEFPTDEETAKAKAALEWAQSELAEKDPLNNYEWNLVRSCDDDSFPFRVTGIVASLLPTYDREMGRKRETANSPNEFLGEVKKRQEWSGLHCLAIITFDGAYGPSHLHKFQDEAGNHLVWWCSRKPLEEGLTYSGKATVKKHEEYRGQNQTVLTRCKFVAEG